LGTLSEIVGGGYFVANCVSDCVNGKRVSATIAGSVLALSAGPSPVTFVKSTIKLSDPFSLPDGKNLAGKLFVASAGVSLIGGKSYTQIFMGSAEGKGWGTEWGVDAGLGVYGGAGALLGQWPKDCCSK
jgi:hypothetical protein